MNSQNRHIENITMVLNEGITVCYRMIRTNDSLLCEEISKNEDDVFSFMLSEINKTEIIEEVFAYDVTRNENTANEIFKLLYENTVTPSTLNYVLEDYLA